MSINKYFLYFQKAWPISKQKSNSFNCIEIHFFFPRQEMYLSLCQTNSGSVLSLAQQTSIVTLWRNSVISKIADKQKTFGSPHFTEWVKKDASNCFFFIFLIVFFSSCYCTFWCISNSLLLVFSFYCKYYTE